MSAIATMESCGAPQLMEQTTAYRERTQSVTVIETHISWVFLTDRFAYKLKKPVSFEFLNYSTPELRKSACEREVELNRRLAPDVYLKVVPITRSARGRLCLNEPGVPVDWVVKMRRLPADRTLERLICSNRLRRDQLDSIAVMLADFYDRQAPLDVRPQNFRGQIRQHVRANRAQLRASFPLLAELVDRVHDAQLRYLTLRPALLDARVCDGRVVDGHGDLRPEHIYVESQPIVIDCLEFRDELRHADIIDELCFLSMECDLLGAADVGTRILSTYCDRTGDVPDGSLIGFYKCYRACVRAKVTALRAQQLQCSPQVRHQAENYLRLSMSYASSLGAPAMIVIGGLMGSGKSTLARSLAWRLSARWEQTDAVRRRLLGSSKAPQPYGTGAYQGAARREVYGELLRRADKWLASGKSVVLDGTFLTNSLREQAQLIARQNHACPLFVWCRCARDTALSRLAQRGVDADSLSEARPELYDRQVAETESPAADFNLLEIDTQVALNAQQDQVLNRLTSQLFEDAR